MYATFLQVRRRIEEKNKLLRQMAGSGREAFAVVELGDVNNQWEAFTTQLQQFDAHLEEQKTGLQVGACSPCMMRQEC